MKAIPCPCKLCWKQYLVLENSGELAVTMFPPSWNLQISPWKTWWLRGVPSSSRMRQLKNTECKKYTFHGGFQPSPSLRPFFVFAKDMPWDGFVNIPGGLVKTQRGSHHLDDEYHINVKCKPWAMNHEHHSVDATRFVAAIWVLCGHHLQELSHHAESLWEPWHHSAKERDWSRVG